MKKLWQKINAKIYIILPVITLLCLVGAIGSYVLPDTVLDTYIVNMEEKEGDSEVALTLEENTHIQYTMDTNGLAMRGIQVGINKQGKVLDGLLHYDVYVINDGDQTKVSSNTYNLAEGFDLQYVYLPYNDYEKCVGKLCIDFYTEGDTEPAGSPALMANHTLIDNTATLSTMDTEFTGSLKVSYIYTHKTYPFLYDFRIMTCIFLAASMAVQYPRRKKLKGNVQSNVKKSTGN